MGVGYVFYVVITPEGKPRREQRTRKFMIYDSEKVAKGKCREGDSVAKMTWDSDQEPIFIKGQLVDTSEKGD